MTAATERVQIQPYSAHPIPTMFSAEMANAAIWKKGWLIGSNASGLLVKYTATTGLTSAGIADKDDDNTANDNRFANVHCGVFSFLQHSGDTFAASDRFAVAYGQDNQTVRKTGTSISPCGVFLGLDPNETSRAMVWVGPAAAALANALLSDDTLAASLAAITNGNGASLIGLEDAGAFTTAATVEAALAELYQHLKSAHVVWPFPLNSAILAAGTPMAAFADNASSNPGITLLDSKAVGIRWNNAASQTAVWTSVDLPLDLDPTAAMTVVILAAKSGATVGDATTFTITAFAQTVGALDDAGSDLGGTSGAMTGNATAKTVQRVTLSIATPPTPPARLSVSIKPSNGTLGTDDVTVVGLWLEYKRKALTS